MLTAEDVTSPSIGSDARRSTRRSNTVEYRAQSALDSSPIYDLHDLSVEHAGGVLLITGTVSSFYHKQLVQEIVRAVAKGIDVINAVDVC
jgi:hypothetical protein